MDYLNLGCGPRHHPGWVNVDLVARGPNVRVHDILSGIPYPDASFDVVYHSHLLEHLPRRAAAAFMRECLRVLRPGGVIRVAVPDLERIARLYLEALDRSLAGDEEWQWHHHWLVLELYDQAVRERSGGGMRDYLAQQPIPNEAFVRKRIGAEADRLITDLRAVGRPFPGRRWSAWRLFSQLTRIPEQVRGWVCGLLLREDEREALNIGRFRQSGEVHRWMYDRHSLRRLLEEVGFRDAAVTSAADSQIAGWQSFELDVSTESREYKPDSLYMEAIKPPQSWPRLSAECDQRNQERLAAVIRTAPRPGRQE